jgi:hypothetical protein
MYLQRGSDIRAFRLIICDEQHIDAIKLWIVILLHVRDISYHWFIDVDKIENQNKSVGRPQCGRHRPQTHQLQRVNIIWRCSCLYTQNSLLSHSRHM